MRFLLAVLVWLPLSIAACAIDAAGRANHSEEVTVDLPDSEHLRNTGGSDGAGLCVFCSLDHAARYQDCQALIGFRDFMTRYPGGGWPEKVSQYIPKMAASKSQPVPEYVQHTGGDVEFLKLALRTGRYPCITYDGRDNVWYRGTIAHMVNLVHLSDSWAVIHDNNNPGKYLWMTPTEFLSRWRGNGGGWAIVLLNPPPPPIPTSRQQPQERVNAQEIDMRALMLMCLIAQPAYGQRGSSWGTQSCPDGSCAPVRSAQSMWHGWYEGSTGNLELYWRGEKIGTLDPLAAKWTTSGKATPVDLIQSFGLSRPTAKPLFEARSPLCGCCDPDDCKCVNCPNDCINLAQAESQPMVDDPFPRGVNPDKISKDVSFECSGKPCSRQQAFFALTQGGLVDDRNKSFLTIVGDKSLRDSVLKDLDTSAALRGWRDKLHVNAYAPDHWAVRQVGLQPGISFQGPPSTEGKAPVEWRFRSYAGDVALAEALRKSDPNYRPDADADPLAKPKPPTPAPEPVKPDVPSTPSGTNLWQWAFMLAAGVAVFLVARRTPATPAK